MLAMLPIGLSGCKSYWIDADVVNQSGEAIHELEVDYPTASFGTNTLADGASMHYRFQTRGNGPIRVEYTSADGKVAHVQGTTLSEREQGRITIRLLAGGKAEFLPEFKTTP